LEASNDAYNFLGVLGLLHGIAWLLALPLVFGGSVRPEKGRNQATRHGGWLN